MTRAQPLRPDEDGVTHINIYSKGQTELGRMLSNWYWSPFEHAVYGKFGTVEGLWYYMQTTDGRRERLRTAQGYEAKQLGRTLRQGMDVLSTTPAFQQVICEAVYAKVLGNPRLHGLLVSNTLPFEHYYVYGAVVREPTEHKWLWTFITNLATYLKETPKP